MMPLLRWLQARAENVAAFLLAAMFFTFVLQVVARYTMAQPFGWTLELNLTLWIWIVFFGCAFVVRERDHVTFDLFYISAPEKARRIMAIVSALAIIIGFSVALYPTYDYIDFMKIRRSAVMRIPLRTVFSVYLIFMVGVIGFYVWRLIHVIRYGVEEPQLHHLEVAEK